MNKDDYVYEEEFDDDTMFVLTKHALLYQTLEDFGIEVGEWKPRLWEAIFESFMCSMVKAGYVEKAEEND